MDEHPFLDDDRAPPWLRELVAPLDDEGYVHVSQRPGLGLDIDFDSIRGHAL
jgi:L-alanine-DL-glutamate epimerase-like enolase superfamily enzyme